MREMEQSVKSNTDSFQSTYPLSPKKFVKKTLPNLLAVMIMSPIIAAGAIVILHVDTLLTGAITIASIIPPIVKVTLLLYGVLLFYLLPYVWYIKRYIATYYYNGDNDFLTIKKGVFTPKEIHVQYQKIQDVYVDQDLLDNLLNIYDVHIASATMTSGIEAHIDGVDRATAEGLKHFLLNKMKNTSSSPIQVKDTKFQQPASYILPENIPTVSINKRWLYMQLLTGFYQRQVIFFISFMVSYLVIFRGITPIMSLSIFWGLPVLILAYFMYNAVVSYIWRKNYRFELQKDYIFLHEGVISQKEQHILYEKIQDVTLNQSILEKIFSLYTVIVQNAVSSFTDAGSVYIPGQTEEDAQALTAALKKIILTKNKNQSGV